MALLIAFETATSFASVALLEGERVLAEVTQSGSRPHSVRLLPAVDAVLAKLRVGLHEVDAAALSIGPGSFTGLRIGLATVKGLFYGDTVPVAPVPTLAALAWAGADAPGAVAACLDARRGEWYAAAYTNPGELEPTGLAEGVYTGADLAARIPRPSTLVGCAGEEAALATLAPALGEQVTLADPATPSAVSVGRLGLRVLEAGDGSAASALVPHYLRRAEAEVRRTGQRLERL